MEMTPRQRVAAAMRGDIPDKTPFTLYAEKLPPLELEQTLRNRGMCAIRRINSYKVRMPNVKIDAHHYQDSRGKNVTRTTYATPYGEVSTLFEPAGFTVWKHEYLFKSPEDYKSILFMLQDSVVEPDYDSASRLVADLGEDFVVRDNLPLEPLQTFISGIYMGMESFCIEWMDNRDEVLKLYDAQAELARKMYPIVADGPLEYCNYGGNVVPQVIGLDAFQKYYVPHYNEAAEILHKKGKLIGCHLDADNTLIMDAVAGTQLDYIEAYDAGMGPSVSAARKAWPNKVLWLNWPSAWHLWAPNGIYEGTLQLIKEAAPGNGFLIGITEDVPEDRWRQNYMAIMDAIDASVK